MLDREALAFRRDETETLLRESFGLSVDADRARDLVERTESCVAALSLAAQSALRRGPPVLAGTPGDLRLPGAHGPGRTASAAPGVRAPHLGVVELTPALCTSVAQGMDAGVCLRALGGQMG